MRETCGMNFARVICDRRATQGVMRNIAFALQARNQRARIRRLNVCRYRRRLALNVTRKMFCAGCAAGAIGKTMSINLSAENRSARKYNSGTVLRHGDRHLALQHRRMVEAAQIGPLESASLPSCAAPGQSVTCPLNRPASGPSVAAHIAPAAQAGDFPVMPNRY